MTNLFIGNLAYDCEDLDLNEFFEQHGITPRSAKVIRDRDTGKGKGFGFVEVEQHDSDAALGLDGQAMTISGRERILRINEAQSKDQGNRGRAARR